MKPIEFKLIRKSLNLSSQDIANIFNVNVRSVWRWEKGYSKIKDKKYFVEIPIEIERFILDLNDKIQLEADNAINKISIQSRKNKKPLLIIFNPDEGKFTNISEYKARNVMMQRCILGLIRIGVKTPPIIVFDIESYKKFYITNLARCSDNDMLVNLQRWSVATYPQYEPILLLKF